jgi:hypothetical protein
VKAGVWRQDARIGGISAAQSLTILEQNRDTMTLAAFCGPVLFRRTTASKLVRSDRRKSESLLALAKQLSARYAEVSFEQKETEEAKLDSNWTD